jgi:hypothetical protein
LLAENTDPFRAVERARDIAIFRDEIEQIGRNIQKLEQDNQMAAFEYSKLVYAWDKLREEKELPLKQHTQRHNELKADIMSNVLHNVTCARRHINNIQKAVVEVEFDKAIASVGGLEMKPDITEQERNSKINVNKRIKTALQMLRPSSEVKRDIEVIQKAAKETIKSLRQHLPSVKGKYKKSGQFTKEQRATKMKNARAYTKSGKHINDFRSPRFPEQRDQQIVERAKSLGVSQDEFRLAVMGNI